jgi:hypothetical protein
MPSIKSVQLEKAVSIDGTEGRSLYEAGDRCRIEVAQGLLNVFVTRTITDESGNRDVEFGAGFPLSGGGVRVVKYQDGVPPTQNVAGEAPRTLSATPPTDTQGFDPTPTVKKSEEAEKQREGVNEQRQKQIDAAASVNEAAQHPEKSEAVKEQHREADKHAKGKK